MWARSLELHVTLGPLAQLGFPGIPPVAMQNPHKLPPAGMPGCAAARDAWTQQGIDVDYFGRPRPKDRPPTPGPFELPEANKAPTRRLWPVP